MIPEINESDSQLSKTCRTIGNGYQTVEIGSSKEGNESGQKVTKRAYCLFFQSMVGLKFNVKTTQKLIHALNLPPHSHSSSTISLRVLTTVTIHAD